MKYIIKLDKTLINQIAAGEVIERPVSVVKELVENSIDSGATKIKVEISEGGIKYISVNDNGSGIIKEDLSIIGEKHATSKIKNINDLYNVLTFGFRGEALSSISSVSNLEIQTRSIYEDMGNSFKIDFGEKNEIKSFPRDKGTNISVKNLFQNTPARLNYLKTPKTEYGYILNYLYQASLAYPKISFEFISDEKTVFIFKENEDLKTRIYNIYSEDFYSHLLEVNFNMEGLYIFGYISGPEVSFPNKSKQNIFVNGRPIKSYTISKAINDAYNRFIPHSMNSGYVLNLEIDPTIIDVNVHPRKLEIRFENEQNIFRAFFHAIEEKLNSVSLIDNSKVNFSSPINTESIEKEKYHVSSGLNFKSYSPYTNKTFNPKQSTLGMTEIAIHSGLSDYERLGRDCEDSGLINNGDLHYTKLGKIVGQAYNSYIIVEHENNVVFYDQHALAERVIYEQLSSVDKKSNTQQLLIAESINISPLEATFLNDNLDTFKQIGFDFELLNQSIIINGIPEFIKKENIKDIFLGILEDLSYSGEKNTKTLDEVKNKIIAYTSCRSAIKFGNKLTLFEMNALLNNSLDNYSSTCPHGRPVVFKITLDELKKKYER